ncbi:hypothetical protein L0152_23335 [bacterium]|nr:hypothetical protein [bacterium]
MIYSRQEQGEYRMKKLSRKQRKERAQKAAHAKWNKERTEVTVNTEASGINILLENEDALYAKAAEEGLKGDRATLKLCIDKLVDLRTKQKESDKPEVIEHEVRFDAYGHTFYSEWACTESVYQKFEAEVKTHAKELNGEYLERLNQIKGRLEKFQPELLKLYQDYQQAQDEFKIEQGNVLNFL